MEEKDFSKRRADRAAIVGEAAIDWLTLTTFNGDQRTMAESVVANNVEQVEWTAGKIGMYTGIGVPQFFIGDASQKGQPHFMLQASGPTSDATVQTLCNGRGRIVLKEWSCTRIDVQVTLCPIEERPPLAEIGYLMRTGNLGEWPSGRVPKISVFSSGDGDTVYIGAPSSARRLRIYDKPVLVGGHKVIYERFEVQLRGDYADACFRKATKRATCVDREALWAYLNREVDRFPEGARPLFAVAHERPDHEAAPQDAPQERPQQNDTGRLRWARYILPALARYASGTSWEAQEVRRNMAEALCTVVTGDPYAAARSYALLDLNAPGARDFANVAAGVYPLDLSAT